jgi:competence protein ComEC
VLGIAIVALVLVDPLLVHALGFQLSVAATAGILAFGSVVARRAPGPPWLADAVGVTLGAQLTVAPLLLATGRPVSLVSVPANLVAGPLAGAAALCGSVTTAPAGVLGGAVGALAQAPARVAVAGVLAVARVAARSPLGPLDGWGLAGVATATLVVCARRFRHAAVVGVLLVVVVAVRSMSFEPAVPTGRHPIAPGAQLVVFDGVAVLELDGRADADDVLAATRRAGVRRVELVVLATDSPRASAVAASVVSRRGPAPIVGPASGPTAPSATDGTTIRVTAADAPWLVDLGGAWVRLDVRDERVVAVDGWRG